jgi:hypothetical protein
VFVAEGASGLYIYPTDCKATDADGEPEIASGLRLRPAWPNPARATTHWQFDLPQAAAVRLEIFDVFGPQRPFGVERAAARRSQRSGVGRSRQCAPAVASGVYIVRLATPSGETRGRVTWMR